MRVSVSHGRIGRLASHYPSRKTIDIGKKRKETMISQWHDSGTGLVVGPIVEFCAIFVGLFLALFAPTPVALTTVLM